MAETIIYHISDIHIRPGVHEDIIFAIKQICELIDNDRLSGNSVMVVIAGDIFEYKNRFEPYDIQCFHEMIDMLENRVTGIITIPGNHDCNLNREDADKLDLVSAALCEFSNGLTGRNHKLYDKLHHFTRTCIYDFSNLRFHVLSPLDKEAINWESIQPDMYNIAILHETIEGSVANMKLAANGRHLNITTLNSFDLVLMGDIHEPQFFNEKIAYCGSLIQKTRGENLEHGCIRWILSQKTVKGSFIPLKLLNAHVTIRLKDNKVLVRPDKNKVINCKSVIVTHDHCSREYMNSIIIKIKKTYGRLDAVSNITPHKTISGETAEPKNSLLQLSNQLELLAEILENHNDKDKILDLHKEYAKQYVEINNYRKWKVNYLFWSNVFCYGENNFIDFRSLQGVVSLIGKNGLGKSSVIDVLFYVLYNVKIRGVSTNFTNFQADKHRVVCSINVGDIEYIIEKTGIKSGKHSTTRLIQCVGEGYKDISEPHLLLTYKKIRDLIGECEDLERNNIAIQDHELYVNKKCTDLKQQLLRFLHLDQLTEIESKVTSDIKSKKVSLTTLTNSLIKLNKVNSAELQNEINAMEQEVIDIQTQLDELTEKREKSLRLLKPTESTVEEIMRKMNSLPNLPLHLTPDEIRAILEQNNNELKDIRQYKYIPLTDTRNENELAAYITSIPENLDYASKIEENNKLIEEQTLYLHNLDTVAIRKLREKIQITQLTIAKLEDDYIPMKRKTKYDRVYVENYVDNSLADAKMEPYDKDIIKQPIDMPDKKLELLLTEKKELEKKLIISRHIHSIQLQYNNACTSCQHNQRELTNTATDAISKSLKTITNQIENWEKYKEYEHNLQICNRNRKIQEYQDLMHDKQYFVMESIAKKIDNKKIELNNMNNDLINAYQQRKNELEVHIHKLIEQTKKMEKSMQQQVERAKAEETLHILRENKRYDEKIRTLEADNKKWREIYGQLGTRESLQKQLAAHKENEATNIELDKLANDIKIFKSKLTKQQQKLIENKLLLKDIKSNEQVQIKIDKLNDELELLKTYKKCINEESGLPFRLSVKYIEQLQDDINKILSKLTNFQIILKHDQKGGLSINSKLDLNAMQMSGSQKFIIDLAIRICLVQNHPFLPDFLIIDEGFGCMDREHLNSTKDFIDSLNKFKGMDFIMLISHIEELHHISNIDIQIKQIDNKSHIEVGEINNMLNLTEVPILDVVADDTVMEELEEGYHCHVCDKLLKMRAGIVESHLASKVHVNNYLKKKSHKN